jgi:hypothetical protein
MSLEARTLQIRLETHQQVTLGSLLEESDCQSALMMAILAKALQMGAIRAELAKEFLGRDSIISRRVP